MSIELVLIPVAIAALAAYQARSEKNEGRVFVQTRLKDPQMLMHACVRAGASSADQASLSASWGDLVVHFQHTEDGSIAAHALGSEDTELIRATLLEVDRHYALDVQSQVLRRLEKNAAAAGLRQTSRRTNSDDSVTVVLEVVSD